jgi:hypothetical protein
VERVLVMAWPASSSWLKYHARHCSANLSRSESKIPEGVADLFLLDGGGVGLPALFGGCGLFVGDPGEDGRRGVILPLGLDGGDVGLPVRS